MTFYSGYDFDANSKFLSDYFGDVFTVLGDNNISLLDRAEERETFIALLITMKTGTTELAIDLIVMFALVSNK